MADPTVTNFGDLTQTSTIADTDQTLIIQNVGGTLVSRRADLGRVRDDLIKAGRNVVIDGDGTINAVSVAWLNGNGAPSAGIGSYGDFYLDVGSGDIYQRTSSWGLIAATRSAVRLSPRGSWNAAINSPTLGSGGSGGVAGDTFFVSTAGSTTLDAQSTWKPPDLLINSGSSWIRIPLSNAFGTMSGQNANAVAITGGTGTLSVLNAGTVTISGGTAALSSASVGSVIATAGSVGSLNVGTVAISGGTATLSSAAVGSVVATAGSIGSLNAGTVAISGGTGTLSSASVGSIVATSGSISSLNVGTVAISGGTGTLSSASVGSIVATSGSVSSLNVGTVAITGGTAALSSLVATTGSLVTANVGTLVATSGTLSGIVSLAMVTGATYAGGSPLVPGFAQTWRDTAGNVAGGILTDGTFRLGAAFINSATISAGTATLSSLTASSAIISGGTATFASLIATSGTLSGIVSLGIGNASYTVGSPLVPGFAQVWRDTTGNVAGGIMADGTFRLGAAFINSATISAGTATLSSLTASSAIISGGTATFASLIATSGTLSGLASIGMSSATFADGLPLVPGYAQLWRDSSGKVAGAIRSDGSFQLGAAFITTATLATATIGDITITGSFSVGAATIGGMAFKTGNSLVPFDFYLSNGTGIPLAYGSNTWWMPALNVAGNVTILGTLSTPNTPSHEVPEYLYDVALSGVVGDGKKGFYYCTWTHSTSSMSIYTYRGSVKITAGQKQLTIVTYIEHAVLYIYGGVAFQRYNELDTICVKGAGLGGADLITTIAKYIDGQNVLLADAASTTLDGSTNSNLIFPCPTSADIGKVIWISSAEYPAHYIGTDIFFDTSFPYPVQPMLAFVNGVPAGDTITLDRQFDGDQTAMAKGIVIGTDNTAALAVAGDAMRAAGKSGMYFKGGPKALYCAFRRYIGTGAERNWYLFGAYDNTIGATNVQEASERDAVWFTGSAEGFFTDGGGRPLSSNRLVPLNAPEPPAIRRSIHGAKTLPTVALQANPIVMELGDSEGSYDASYQIAVQTPASMTIERFRWDNKHKASIKGLNYSMGASNWPELACPTATRGLGIANVYLWNDGSHGWLSFAQNLSPAADVYQLSQHGINDQGRFHPLLVFSVVNRLRAITTRTGTPADIVLQTSTTNQTNWTPSVGQVQNFYEESSGWCRSLATKYNWGLLDWEAAAIPQQWGFSPVERLMRRYPEMTQAITPSSPYSFGHRARLYAGIFILKGANGAAVWGPGGFKTLRFALSQRSDNFIEIGVDASGYLTKYVQSWGDWVDTPCTIANGSTTLTTSGQTSYTGPVTWAIGRWDIMVGPDPGGPMAGSSGKCFLISDSDFGGRDQRSFVTNDYGANGALLRDPGPWKYFITNATRTVKLGGIMFVDHDAWAQTDIIIDDGAGHVLKTKIVGYTSANQVTLRDPWTGPSLSNLSVHVFIGHISVPLTSTTIQAYSDSGSDPFISFSLAPTYAMVRYGPGSKKDTINDALLIHEDVIVRGGGEFMPVISCTGAGGNLQGTDLWIDMDLIYKVPATSREMRGSQDYLAGFTFYRGGVGSHMGSDYGLRIARPVLDAQDFAA